MLKQIIDEIDSSLKHKNYFAALTLSLLIPDICGKEEWPKDNESSRYKKWYAKYFGIYENPNSEDDLEEDRIPWMSADVLYSLRCSVIHEGECSIDTKIIKQQVNKIDDFIVYFDDKSFEMSSSSVDRSNDNRFIEYKVNGYHLCKRLRNVAYNVYVKPKEEE